MRKRLPRKLELILTRRSVRLFAALARGLPLRWMHRLGDATGRLIFHLARKRQRRADRNLVMCFGDRFDAKARARIRLRSVQCVAKTMLELLRLPVMSDSEWERQVTITGHEQVEKILAEKRGVIVVSSHFGNWELVGAACARLGWDAQFVVRDAKDPVIATIINSARTSVGVNVLRREQVRKMVETLREGKCLGIVPDQHAKTGGIWVNFLGRPASTFRTPAALARRTGAAVVPCSGMRMPDDTIHVCFLPPLDLPRSRDLEADVRVGTQLINDVLGEEISRHPEQWLWLDDRWRTPSPSQEVSVNERPKT